ncbi:MAG: peptidylprolyl isomerase [Methylacidiphilales bacterium]|nr:peptidylprolyl isomerase [Candidatus Methylacidiphilales bacterium]
MKNRINQLAIVMLFLQTSSGIAVEKPADNFNPQAPVATINGKVLTQGEVYRYRDYLRENGVDQESLDPNKLALSMVQEEVLVQEATKSGFAKGKNYEYEVAINRKKVLITALLKDYLSKNQPTPAEIDSAYQDYSRDKKEYEVRHILVDDPALADDLVQKLNNKEPFSDLAKKHSRDNSAENGGRLGWIAPSRVVPEFRDALTALSVNELTKKPVKSQFGWHIIQNLGVRDREIKTYEEIKEELLNQVRQKKIGEYSQYLVSKAKIVLPNEGKKVSK